MDEQTKPTLKEKLLGGLRSTKGKALAAIAAGAAVLTGPASAEAMNWSAITEVITGAAGIFPGIVTLITAAIPALMTLAVVSFVMGIFAAILGGMKNGFDFRF